MTRTRKPKPTEDDAEIARQAPEVEADDCAEAEESAAARIGAAARTTWQVATLGPRFALHMARTAAVEAEERAMRHVRDRLNAMASEDLPRGGASPSTSNSRHPDAARAYVHRLLQAARRQTLGQAEQHLYLRIARQLVPDEARLLAYLFEGHTSALMHVGSGPLVGPATRRWLENLSPVAHEANLTIRDRTPTYIAHLRGLGLVESGEEDPSLKATYQKMEVDTEVREATRQMEEENHRPRFYRRTLQLSAAGRHFCEACMDKAQD